MLRPYSRPQPSKPLCGCAMTLQGSGNLSHHHCSKPAPPSMHHRNDATACITDNNGQAIGCEYSQHAIGIAGKGGISGINRNGLFVMVLVLHHLRPMHLIEPAYWPWQKRL